MPTRHHQFEERKSPPRRGNFDTSQREALPPDQKSLLFHGKGTVPLRLLEEKGFPGAGSLNDVIQSSLSEDAKTNGLMKRIGDIVENTRKAFVRIMDKVGLADPSIRNLVVEYLAVLHKIRTRAAMDSSKLKLHKLKMDSKIKRIKRKQARLKRFAAEQLQVDHQEARYIREISDELVRFSSFVQRRFTGHSPYLNLLGLLEPIIVKSQSLLEKYRCSKTRALLSALASGALTALVLGCAVATGPSFPLAIIIQVVVSSIGSSSTSVLAYLFRRQRINNVGASDIRDHAMVVKAKLEKTVIKGGDMYYYGGLSAGGEYGDDGRKDILRECAKAEQYLDEMLACVNELVKSASKPLFKPSKRV
ncbi:hypothetical protein AAMO2058_001526500 [Amorphochlora amoebiformis]